MSHVAHAATTPPCVVLGWVLSPQRGRLESVTDICARWPTRIVQDVRIKITLDYMGTNSVLPFEGALQAPDNDASCAVVGGSFDSVVDVEDEF